MPLNIRSEEVNQPILTGEPDFEMLADLLESSRSPVTSPVAVFEAALGICRKRHSSVEEARRDVLEFLEIAGIEMVSIGDSEANTALDAFARYGKGRGHPAQLNLGDCFAYAVAKNLQIPLLFKGNDFSKTDIPRLAR